MKSALALLCVLIVSVPVAAQTNEEIYQYLIQLGREKGESVADLELRLKVDQAYDYDNPVTRAYAMQIAKPALSNVITIGQVCDIFDAVTLPHWTYFPDPYGTCDTIAKASESIALALKGDCDDFAVVVAACIRAIGGAYRILLVYAGSKSHAYAEVFIGDQSSAERIGGYIVDRYHVLDVRAHIDDDDGYWLPLDWAGTPPRWADAYPGHEPSIDRSAAEKSITVPIYSAAEGVALPVPTVP